MQIILKTEFFTAFIKQIYIMYIAEIKLFKPLNLNEERI